MQSGVHILNIIARIAAPARPATVSVDRSLAVAAQ
jgi:hypothetical protein